MIKEVTYYVTSNGTIFYDRDEANEYELNCFTNGLTSEDLIIIGDDNYHYSLSSEFEVGVEKATLMYIKTEKA